MSGDSTASTLQYTGIGIFVVIVLYAVLHYGRMMTSGRARHQANNAGAITVAFSEHNALGLDPEDVAVLPTFTYRASPGKGKVAAAADCAVCLDELQDGAVVRVLPACKHYFHARCVDVWLWSHSTCPVCRTRPEPEMVRLGVASVSPPLPQLRRCGASPERVGTSEARDRATSWSPSPVRSPATTVEVFGSKAPSPTFRAKSPSPAPPTSSPSPRRSPVMPLESSVAADEINRPMPQSPAPPTSSPSPNRSSVTPLESSVDADELIRSMSPSPMHLSASETGESRSLSPATANSHRV